MNLSNFSLRTRVNAFFISLVLISTINFAMVIYLENKSIEDYQWVRNTHESIESSGYFLLYLSDTVAGQSGYIETNNLDYLEAYYAGAKRTQATLQELLSISTHNAEQHKRLVKIEGLLTKLFIYLKQSINSIELQGEKQHNLESNSTQSKTLISQIKLELELFKQQEKALLQLRNDSLVELQKNIRLIFIIESIAFVLVLSLLGWIVSKTILTPINKLYESVKAFEISKTFKTVDVYNEDEIGSLANAFNYMGSKVVADAANLQMNKLQAENERDKALVQAVTDPLTGLFNRRFMEVELTKLISFSHRYKHDLSVVMVDIDHFKKVNDVFGHVVGDTVIIEIATILGREIRGSDLAVRYGGEEFTIVLSHTSVSGAKVKAEEIRKEIESLKILELKGHSVTVSLGITELKSSDETINQLLERADEALYQAKNSGRNRSCVA